MAQSTEHGVTVARVRWCKGAEVQCKDVQRRKTEEEAEEEGGRRSRSWRALYWPDYVVLTDADYVTLCLATAFAGLSGQSRGWSEELVPGAPRVQASNVAVMAALVQSTSCCSGGSPTPGEYFRRRGGKAFTDVSVERELDSSYTMDMV